MSESSKALPRRYIDGLFDRLMAYYGEKFVRMWSVMDASRMRDVWAEELGDLTAAELKRGLAACRTREWPPTLPEFRNLCRAPLDYETAFHEAAFNYGMHGAQWTSPAIYWAAVQIGGDVRTLPYKALANRWKTALDWAQAHKANEPVPVREAKQLEDHGSRPVPMPESVRQQFKVFYAKFGAGA